MRFIIGLILVSLPSVQANESLVVVEQLLVECQKTSWIESFFQVVVDQPKTEANPCDLSQARSYVREEIDSEYFRDPLQSDKKFRLEAQSARSLLYKLSDPNHKGHTLSAREAQEPQMRVIESSQKYSGIPGYDEVDGDDR